jgi:hypothetical protein
MGMGMGWNKGRKLVGWGVAGISSLSKTRLKQDIFGPLPKFNIILLFGCDVFNKHVM